MFSLFHSDWYRKVLVETRDGSVTHYLFEDTGWWRGSNLYLHKSGVYFLDDGQNGCHQLNVLPSQADAHPLKFECEKSRACSANTELWSNSASQQFPPSVFYKDFRYIGYFVETSRKQEPISFMPSDKLYERELPE